MTSVDPAAVVPLQAAPPGKGRVDALDGWRGVACLLVACYHVGFNLRWPPLVVLGFCGVQMFFVLSGHLLYRPYAQAMRGERAFPSSRLFYARRFLRIYPPYLVALAAFVLLRYATGTKPPGAWSVLAHVGLFFNYVPSIDFFSINPVFWSLAIEAQFYVLLPVACLAARRLKWGPWVVPFAFAAVGIAARAIELRISYDLPPGVTAVGFRSVFAYLDLFAFGMVVAVLPTGWRMPRPRIVAAAGLGLFLLANNWSFLAGGGEWMVAGDRTLLL